MVAGQVMAGRVNVRSRSGQVKSRSYHVQKSSWIKASQGQLQPSGQSLGPNQTHGCFSSGQATNVKSPRDMIDLASTNIKPACETIDLGSTNIKPACDTIDLASTNIKSPT